MIEVEETKITNWLSKNNRANLNDYEIEKLDALLSEVFNYDY